MTAKRFLLGTYTPTKEPCMCSKMIPGLYWYTCPVHRLTAQTSICDRKLAEAGTTVPQIEVVNLNTVGQIGRAHV